jgi:hypothetical protein
MEPILSEEDAVAPSLDETQHRGLLPSCSWRLGRRLPGGLDHHLTLRSTATSMIAPLAQSTYLA